MVDQNLMASRGLAMLENYNKCSNCESIMIKTIVRLMVIQTAERGTGLENHIHVLLYLLIYLVVLLTFIKG